MKMKLILSSQETEVYFFNFFKFDSVAEFRGIILRFF